jgi:hypothetical protein
MSVGSRAALVALAACAIRVAVACGPRPSFATSVPAVTAARTLRFDELLGNAAEVTVTMHPPAIVQDRVYGPLLRRASTMAAAYAGPRTVGTTALAVLERTDEVVVASNGATGEAIVVLRGVPAELDAARIVDEHGSPIWRAVVGDVGRSVVEYEPSAPADAALFVLPPRLWIIATGEAKSRAREALLGPISPSSLPAEEAPLAVLSIRGTALVERDGRLRDGALAPLGRALLRASFELAPGSQGVIDARLVYADPGAAGASEETLRDVVAAFRRRLTSPNPPPLAWLAAAGVERTAATVTVRAPIPKPWLDALSQADVATPPAPKASGAPSSPDPVPWQLWHRPASPSQGLPFAPVSPHDSSPQDSSQRGGSL